MLIEGYDVTEAENGLQAIEFVKQQDFDLIIMDIMMPKMDGYQAVKEIKNTKDIPVLMLSARAEEFDKLLGFELGIDDYVTKPFSPKELVARIKAITKRKEKNTNSFVFGGLVLDENKNIALSREQLLTNIWGYDFYGDDRTVDTHVKTLRNNLGKYRDNIITIRKVGYKFEYKEKDE